jgi:heme-degrading monooxygenase HmoA
MIAATPEPPYVAVIFTSLRTEGDQGYAVMSARMDRLAARQPGYLGMEAARDGLGITVSYWADEDAARAWKQVAEHLVAQQRGRDAWYSDYRVRVAVVHRDYGPSWPDLASSSWSSSCAASSTSLWRHSAAR